MLYFTYPQNKFRTPNLRYSDYGRIKYSTKECCHKWIYNEKNKTPCSHIEHFFLSCHIFTDVVMRIEK